MKNINILVTGANGFVGKALLTGLVEEAQGHKITAMHRSELREQTYDSSIQWLRADIITDNLVKATTGIDIVYHLAAYSSVSESIAERHLLDQVNVLGTQRLAVACKEAGVRHFIYVSSIAACEASPASLVTESNGFPNGAYGRSKKVAEDVLLKMSDSTFQVTILRPTALFGENHLGSMYELVKAIHQKRFFLFGDGSNHTNFYYIHDFIDVLLMTKNNVKSHGQIFISADKPCQLKELVLCIKHVLGLKPSIYKMPVFLGYAIATGCDILGKLTRKPMPLSRRRYQAMRRDMIYCNSKLQQTLDYIPRHGVFRGLHQTIQWYREAGLI
jgi:nucleoside-diphosphate-sugar epimerase